MPVGRPAGGYRGCYPAYHKMPTFYVMWLCERCIQEAPWLTPLNSPSTNPCFSAKGEFSEEYRCFATDLWDCVWFQCIRWRPAEADSCCPWLFRACFLTDMLVILYCFSIGFVWQQDIMSEISLKTCCKASTVHLGTRLLWCLRRVG